MHETYRFRMPKSGETSLDGSAGSDRRPGEDLRGATSGLNVLAEETEFRPKAVHNGLEPGIVVYRQKLLPLPSKQVGIDQHRFLHCEDDWQALLRLVECVQNDQNAVGVGHPNNEAVRVLLFQKGRISCVESVLPCGIDDGSRNLLKFTAAGRIYWGFAFLPG